MERRGRFVCRRASCREPTASLECREHRVDAIVPDNLDITIMGENFECPPSELDPERELGRGMELKPGSEPQP